MLLGFYLAIFMSPTSRSWDAVSSIASIRFLRRWNITSVTMQVNWYSTNTYYTGWYDALGEVTRDLQYVLISININYVSIPSLLIYHHKHTRRKSEWHKIYEYIIYWYYFARFEFKYEWRGWGGWGWGSWMGAGEVRHASCVTLSQHHILLSQIFLPGSMARRI